jgi:thiamine transport system ATP-binding protein
VVVVLVVGDVVVRFGSRTVLDRVRLTVDRQEIVALQGPSGCGKSTLLRVIAGLLPPDAGTVHLDGRDVTPLPPHRRGIGLVFQDDQLFPHLDVEANVAFGLRMQRVPAAERCRRVDELLELVGLAGFGSRSVTSLSGGEAKRIALARSLARPRAPHHGHDRVDGDPRPSGSSGDRRPRGHHRRPHDGWEVTPIATARRERPRRLALESRR